MELVRLPIGEQGPPESDCIRIEEQEDRMFKLTASALCNDDGEDEVESVSIVGGGPLFATAAQAEEAGLAWAQDVGATRLYISVGTLEQPLKPLEIDLPL